MNSHLITISEWLSENGFESLEDAESMLMDSVMPALCDEFCDVEPDGKCTHGCPSPLLALGLI